MQQRLIFSFCILLFSSLSFAAVSAGNQSTTPTVPTTSATPVTTPATPTATPTVTSTTGGQCPASQAQNKPAASTNASSVPPATAANTGASQNPAATTNPPTRTPPAVRSNSLSPISPAAASSAPLSPASANNMVLKTDKDKISYAIGVDMGTTLRTQNISVTPEVLAQGIKDGLNNGKLLLSQQEIINTLANLQKQVIAKREADFKTLAEQNKRAGEAFLQANKAKPGVVTLPSGLQYKIITVGKGAQPADKDSVTVHYAGNLLNGQEFDSSYQRNKPAVFPVAEVIPGWSEALRLMKVGSTWEIYVPSNLAYGERGLPNSPIGPNQTLVFKINLISVEKKK